MGGVESDCADPLRLVQVDDGEPALAPIPEYVDGSEPSVELAARPDPGGVTAALDDTVDCVVAEYGAADGDGASVVEAVRSERPALPVVVVTDGHRPDAVRDALDAGATAHLDATALEATPAKLRHRLETAVERYDRQRRTARNDRVADLVSRIDRRLVRAESRREIEAAVCEEVSQTEPYPFAWVGTPCEEGATIRERASDGDDDGYLDDVTIRADQTERGRGPAGRAVRTGDIVVTEEVSTDEAFEPWAERALDRGFESVAAVPLEHTGTTYGVLVLYGDRERSMLEQLSANVSQALHETVLRIELVEYREMVERAGNAMFLADEEASLTYVNDAFERLVGEERDAVTGDSLRDLDVDVAPGDARDHLVRSIQDGSGWSGEFELESGDEDRTVDVRVTPITAGGETRYVGVGTDVTERETYRERIEAQRDNLRLLNRILGHDIRNDAQILLGMSDLLADHVDGDAQQYLDRIGQKSRHIDELTQSARSLTGTITTAGGGGTTPVDLDRVLGDEIEDLETSYDVSVSSDAQGGEPAVAGGEMLNSVFRNLLQNAVQHSGGTDIEVEVATEVTEDAVRVRVADDGPGIPDDRKRDLFASGAQGDDSGGSGLGLFLVDTLVEKYGGEVWVEDDDPEGAVFVVELARTAPAAE